MKIVDYEKNKTKKNFNPTYQYSFKDGKDICSNSIKKIRHRKQQHKDINMQSDCSFVTIKKKTYLQALPKVVACIYFQQYLFQVLLLFITN